MYTKHEVKTKLKGLPEKERKALVRRGRDTFNKDEEVQLEMLSQMILGKAIKTSDIGAFDYKS